MGDSRYITRSEVVLRKETPRQYQPVCHVTPWFGGDSDSLELNPQHLQVQVAARQILPSIIPPIDVVWNGLRTRARHACITRYYRCAGSLS
jgi:hypothetical protein